jgi:deoxyribonuclease V
MNALHEWDLPPQEAISLQRTLALRVELQPIPSHFEVIAAADVGYVASVEELVAAMVTFSWPDLQPIERASGVYPITFPYIPGLLSFREIPPLLEVFGKLKRRPDVLLCDGQGLAHPRAFGLACHLGLWLGIPTVGCAKTLLCGKHEPLEFQRGEYRPLILKDRTVGYVFRSRDGVKPLYVSPGHLADLDTSLDIIRRCLGRYRIPEPLRQAHNLATQMRQTLIPEAVSGIRDPRPTRFGR